MGLFDGRVKVATRISLEGDDFAPGMGALTGSAHKEDVLNHGTLNQVVQGDVTRNFLLNETITVGVNQNLTVCVNRSTTVSVNDSLTVGANLTETVAGMVTQTFGGGQMTTCGGPHVRTDASSSVWMCPGGTFINSGTIYEAKATNCAFYAFQQQNVAVAADVFGLKTEVVVAKNASEALTTKAQNLCNKVVAGLRNTAQATCIAIHLMRSDMTGAHPEVRAVRPAVGCEISAPPSSMPGVQ